MLWKDLGRFALCMVVFGAIKDAAVRANVS